MNRFFTTINSVLRLLTGNSSSPTLPQFLFLIGTFFFPQVNVDLIIRINNTHILFTKRNDSFGNNGWHLPGSIIRPNETFERRIKALIQTELPFLSEYLSESITYAGFTEVFSRDIPGIRSHFISHIYLLDYSLSNKCIDRFPPSAMVSQTIPDDLIANHHRYRPVIRKCLNRAPIVPEQYY